MLSASQQPKSKEALAYRLSATAIEYICDECTEGIRPYITNGGTKDPPPSEVRAAVCSSMSCADRFSRFVAVLNTTRGSDLDELCAMDDAEGNRAMGRLLNDLAFGIEKFMGLDQSRLVSEDVAEVVRGWAEPPRRGRATLALSAAVAAALGVAAMLAALVVGGRTRFRRTAHATRREGGARRGIPLV